MRKLLFLLTLLLCVPVGACNLGDIVVKGSTSRSVALDIIDSTDGTPETGVVFNTSGIDLWYRREGAAVTSITEATLAALTTAWSSGGFLHISNGAYRLDVPDAAFATSANYVDIGGTVTGMVVICVRVRLVDTNIEVAATPANVTQFNGSNATSASGRPEVNLSHIAGSAVSTSTAQLGVNVVGWTGSDLATGTGPLPGLGVLDRGTAQSDSTTTGQLRSAATFADSELNGATWLVYSATTGAGQRSSIASYVGSTDTATLSPALPTDPTGTHRYEIFAVSPAAGSVSITTGGITSSSFASGAIDATAIATDALGSAEIASTAGTEIGTATWATTTRALTELDEDNTTIDINATTLGTVTTASTVSALAANAITAAATAADFGTEVAAATLVAQGSLTGTCSSGSTTTCVDAARTEADATLLQDRLICFNDGWCAMLTTFNPGTDTATTTKTAPSTRASKTYTIFPSTAQ